MTMLYWKIGKRINEEVLQYKRAEYGKNIISTLALQLTTEYGKGWNKRHLHHCIRFAEIFPDIQIVNALRTQLRWSSWSSPLRFTIKNKRIAARRKQ